MALDQFLLSVVRDPIDHGVLHYVESASVLYNPRLKVAYTINGAIPVPVSYTHLTLPTKA